jgi:hypothetical protein
MMGKERSLHIFIWGFQRSLVYFMRESMRRLAEWLHDRRWRVVCFFPLGQTCNESNIPALFPSVEIAKETAQKPIHDWKKTLWNRDEGALAMR